MNLAEFHHQKFKQIELVKRFSGEVIPKDGDRKNILADLEKWPDFGHRMFLTEYDYSKAEYIYRKGISSTLGIQKDEDFNVQVTDNVSPNSSLKIHDNDLPHVRRYKKIGYELVFAETGYFAMTDLFAIRHRFVINQKEIPVRHSCYIFDCKNHKPKTELGIWTVLDDSEYVKYQIATQNESLEKILKKKFYERNLELLGIELTPTMSKIAKCWVKNKEATSHTIAEKTNFAYSTVRNNIGIIRERVKTFCNIQDDKNLPAEGLVRLLTEYGFGLMP